MNPHLQGGEAQLPIGSLDPEDQRPQGICDSCARVVRASDQAERIEATDPLDLIRQIIGMAERQLHRPRCSTCGMVK